MNYPDTQEEYNYRRYDIKCGECGYTAYLTQAEAETLGWSLTRKGEFCPDERLDKHTPTDQAAVPRSRDNAMRAMQRYVRSGIRPQGKEAIHYDRGRDANRGPALL